MTARKTLTIYAGLLIYTLAPVLSVLIAACVAKLAKVPLDEGNAHPCVVLGVDIGGLLNSMLIFGWLGLVTLPTGGIAILIFHFMRSRAARHAGGQGGIL